MKRFVTYFLFLFVAGAALALTIDREATSAVDSLLNRISPGLSGRLEVSVVDSPADSTDVDWFEIYQSGDRPAVKGNSAISVATGINWYLKYMADVHLSWGNMNPALPTMLPAVENRVRRSSPMRSRYYLNYCTHSYSMAFWDWARWQQEIDWMALHGINMPLTVTGMGTLWRNVLRRLDYPEERIDSFIAGPGFRAWWLMNNLEGWGGPNSEADYDREARLQQQILDRMHRLGMEPVMAGYSGMLPHDATQTLGVDVADPGKWCGFTRPAFLQPTDKDFDRIADIYYSELTSLYGPAKYYSMDPFHEGGNTAGVDLASSGQKILAAMHRTNPEGVWVIQGWQENPRREMIEPLPQGSLLVLDLQSENTPSTQRIGNYGHHDWLYCMLLNFGGNEGLYGKMSSVADGLDSLRNNSSSLRGVGLTMEGIENNPVMFELLSEMPWRPEHVNPEAWVADYATARYGRFSPEASEAWRLLSRTVYDCPRDSIQQGTIESLFCARPSDRPLTASAWAASKDYYRHADLLRAARLLAEAAPLLGENRNYQHDLVDVVRQCVANRGRELLDSINLALMRRDSVEYKTLSDRFLSLIDTQDRLLATLPEFRLGSWLEAARNCASTESDADRWEWNARTQITTWGPREASEGGRLHDYSNREWQGLLADFYRRRWQLWFDTRLNEGLQPTPSAIDFYPIESAWATGRTPYSSTPEGNPIATALLTLNELMEWRE